MFIIISSLIVVCHHKFKRVLNQVNFPKRRLIGELFGFLWDEVRQNLFFEVRLFIQGVEYSLALDVSQILVKIDRQEEFTSFVFEFCGAYNNIRFLLLEFASSGIFPFSLDWRHELKSIFVK